MMADNTVECRSEGSYAQKPMAFTWQGYREHVDAILSEGRSPQGKVFLVLTDEGERFTLTYFEEGDHWLIEPAASPDL